MDETRNTKTMTVFVHGIKDCNARIRLLSCEGILGLLDRNYIDTKMMFYCQYGIEAVIRTLPKAEVAEKLIHCEILANLLDWDEAGK